MKEIKLITFTIFIMLCNLAFSQEHKVLVLAPENNEIVYVNSGITMVHVLLSSDKKIDSTSYKVITMNRLRQRSVQQFSEKLDPSRLLLPMNNGGYSEVELTTYYQGKILRKQNFQVVFREKNDYSGEYVYD
jgi:hypothetical protein